jgi:hypothetical protein
MECLLETTFTFSGARCHFILSATTRTVGCGSVCVCVYGNNSFEASKVCVCKMLLHPERFWRGEDFCVGCCSYKILGGSVLWSLPGVSVLEGPSEILWRAGGWGWSAKDSKSGVRVQLLYRLERGVGVKCSCVQRNSGGEDIPLWLGGSSEGVCEKFGGDL